MDIENDCELHGKECSGVYARTRVKSSAMTAPKAPMKSTRRSSKWHTPSANFNRAEPEKISQTSTAIWPLDEVLCGGGSTLVARARRNCLDGFRHTDEKLNAEAR
jgi:hypothetical protein